MIDLKSLVLAKKMFGGGGAESTPEQSKSVNLAMAEGNQTITPDEGYVLSEVTIIKPDTHIPENIAEGVDIGGVIGSLATNGAVVKCGYFVATSSTNFELTHDLGVIPDIIMITVRTLSSSDSGFVAYALMQSEDFIKKYNPTFGGYLGMARSNVYSYNTAIDFTTSATLPINSVNESTMKIGISSYPLSTDYAYYWYAIGGLT